MSIHLTLDQPLRFQPWFRPAVWGGHALARFLGKNPPQDQPCGESWEVSDHLSHASALATGTLFGTTLRQLMESHREELLGPAAGRFDRFPWLIKLLDAEDWLSVQVHPNEEDVQRWLPGEGAKSEAWLVLDAKPGSGIYAGLKPGVGPSEFSAMLEQGTVGQCLHFFEAEPGDLLYLPAGTVHAVGGGVLLAEIQQTSDATFRLFDWNRKDADGRSRPLHIEQGLACIDWHQGPRDPIPTRFREGLAGEWRAPLVRCPYFEIDALCRQTPFSIGGESRLQSLIVTASQGRFDNGDFVMAGDSWVLPASMAPMMLHPAGGICALLCTLR